MTLSRIPSTLSATFGALGHSAGETAMDEPMTKTKILEMIQSERKPSLS
jgi:hypothetical protein